MHACCSIFLPFLPLSPHTCTPVLRGPTASVHAFLPCFSQLLSRLGSGDEGPSLIPIFY